MLENITDASKYYLRCQVSQPFGLAPVVVHSPFHDSSLGGHELCTSAKAGLSWSRSGFAVLDIVSEWSCRARADGSIRSGHAKV